MKLRSILRAGTRTLLYVILQPIRYSISFFIFCCIGIPFVLFEFLMIGNDHTPDGGLLSWMGAFMVFCDRWNKRMIGFVLRFKPHGWTFKKAVHLYKDTSRHWINRGKNDFEYRNFINKAARDYQNQGDFFPERRFWKFIKEKVDAGGEAG